jgi:ribosomal protein S18 acetylase RimI-like enzyme
MEVRPAGWDDFDAVCELLEARSRAVHGISDMRPEHVRAEWELPSFTVGADNWVADVDGRAAGYAALSPTHDLVHAARDPAAGDALLAAAVARARERDLDVIRVVVASADEPLNALVERGGFEPGVEVLRMWKTLDGADPDPVWPEGVSVRTFEEVDAGAVKGLLDEAYLAGAVKGLLDEAYLAWDRSYVPMARDDWVRWMTEDADFDPAVWWLAEDDGVLAGVALHWRGGWLKDLAVRESQRGRGLGTALLRHGFHEFERRGVERIGLKVDGANPTGAIRLYERTGFVTDRRERVWSLCP